MLTQEQIDDAIKGCVWRREIEGVSVCGGAILPCIKAIEKGQCDTLIKLYAENKDGE